MEIGKKIKNFWKFLQKDSWQSWVISLVLIIVFIKLIFFPLLSFFTGSSLPLVVVESCSMYHESGFNEWWSKNKAWYNQKDIFEENFKSYPLKNGLNKGDIIFVLSKKSYDKGDIIIFNAPTRYPIIHRIISLNPISTKGDHNFGQLSFEKGINREDVLGKAFIKIPFLGWIKLIFMEPFKPSEQRGFCR